MSSPKNLFEPLPHEIEHPTLKKSRLTQDEKLLTVSKNQKSLLVSSVNSIMQVKTFYDYDPKFEPNEDHFECYRTNIKEI